MIVVVVVAAVVVNVVLVVVAVGGNVTVVVVVCLPVGARVHAQVAAAVLTAIPQTSAQSSQP